MLLAPGPDRDLGAILRREAPRPGRSCARGPSVTGMGRGRPEARRQAEHGRRNASNTSTPYWQFASGVPNSGKWYANPSKCQSRRNRPFASFFEIRTGSVKSRGPERKRRRRTISSARWPVPVNSSSLKTPGNLPLSAAVGLAESAARMGTGGEGGIRTHGTVARTSVFETDPFDRSGTSPHGAGWRRPEGPRSRGPAV